MRKDLVVPGITRAFGQSRPLFDEKSREINASSNADAIRQIGEYLRLLSSPDKAASKSSVEASTTDRLARKEKLTAAFADKTNETMQVIAESVGVEVIESTNRDGFARRLVMLTELAQGDWPIMTIREKQVLAYVLSSPTMVIPTEIRNREFLLNEFSINARILIDSKTVNRSNKDLLEEKYEESLEAIMVQEDRCLKTAMDKLALVRNNLETTASFTPQFFAHCMDIITRTGLPCSTCLMSSTIIQDMIAGAEFQQVFDPMTQYEVLQTGEIGQLYTVSILTDMPRQPNMRVLEPGDAYFLAPAENLGAMFTRPMLTEAIDMYNLGYSKRGWFFEEPLSMALTNGYAVVKAKRL